MNNDAQHISSIAHIVPVGHESRERQKHPAREHREDSIDSIVSQLIFNYNKCVIATKFSCTLIRVKYLRLRNKTEVGKCMWNTKGQVKKIRAREK